MSEVVTQLVPVWFGDVELQGQATRLAGTERTSTAADKVVAAYAEAEAAIIGCLTRDTVAAW